VFVIKGLAQFSEHLIKRKLDQFRINDMRYGTYIRITPSGITNQYYGNWYYSIEGSSFLQTLQIEVFAVY